ncbi:MAG: prolyl oligopeptidase family serine peptidase [Planctomycetaceae bacterium]|nr:prolyl oligopeptidase family serine peptidase [Planctomycetaceae bacterium]
MIPTTHVTRLLVVGFAITLAVPVRGDEPPPLTEISVTSTLDGSRQPSRIWVPDAAATKPAPLLVYLHTWSGDYRQQNVPWLLEASRRGWIFLGPNFRGRNDTPAACGSKLARRDILDAIDWTRKHHRVDGRRIYLAGTSGGGHMAMLMAGHHPRRFSAVSAWVGISDLSAWYRFHLKDGKPQDYARMILKCLGGPPGQSVAIDRQYRDRSPLFFLARARDVPLDLCAGVHDGKTGSVRIHHTLLAWNVVARARKSPVISDKEIEQLWTASRLREPGKDENRVDPEFKRKIHLRRRSGPSRVTIFEGGHEGLAGAGCQWLSRQSRPTNR